MFAKIENGQIVEYPYSLSRLREDRPNLSLPAHLTASVLAELGLARVIVTGPPPHDPATHVATEGTPAYDPPSGGYRQTWSVQPIA